MQDKTFNALKKAYGIYGFAGFENSHKHSKRELLNASGLKK